MKLKSVVRHKDDNLKKLIAVRNLKAVHQPVVSNPHNPYEPQTGARACKELYVAPQTNCDGGILFAICSMMITKHSSKGTFRHFNSIFNGDPQANCCRWCQWRHSRCKIVCLILFGVRDLKAELKRRGASAVERKADLVDTLVVYCKRGSVLSFNLIYDFFFHIQQTDIGMAA